MSGVQLRSRPYPIRGKVVALSASGLPPPTKLRGKNEVGRHFADERDHAEQKAKEIDQLAKDILGMNEGDLAFKRYWSPMNEKATAGFVTALKRILNTYVQIPKFLTAKGRHCSINKYTRRIGDSDPRGSFGSICEAVRGNPFDAPNVVHDRWENAKEVFIVKKRPLTDGGKEALNEVRIMHQMAGCAQSVHLKSFYFHKDVGAPTQCLEAELNHCFIVMDKADCSLLDYIHDLRSNEQHVSVSGCTHVLLDCLSGLTHMQLRGIIHGNIKPSHILLKKRAELKANGESVTCAVLCDYGNATIGVHRANAMGGTPTYASPEQYRCMNGALWGYTNKTDTYALALSILELLTKKHAIKHSDDPDAMLGQMENMVMLSLPAPYEQDHSLRDWLNQMLKADEKHRFDAISMVARYGQEMLGHAKAEGCPHDLESRLKMG